MKPGIVLLMTADPVLQNVGSEAVIRSRHGLRIATNFAEALAALSGELDDVELIILDLDGDIHGSALLSALSVCADRIPVLTVTSFEPDYANRFVVACGAKACRGKPLGIEQLAADIAHF